MTDIIFAGFTDTKATGRVRWLKSARNDWERVLQAEWKVDEFDGRMRPISSHFEWRDVPVEEEEE